MFLDKNLKEIEGKNMNNIVSSTLHLSFQITDPNYHSFLFCFFWSLNICLEQLHMWVSKRMCQHIWIKVLASGS